MKNLTPQKICNKILVVLFSKTRQRTNRLGMGMPDKALMPLQFKSLLVLNLKAVKVKV